ncbi:MAG: transglutaminase family protein [Cellulomonadaceae bacterium]
MSDLRIEHVTTFEYVAPVTISYNEARMQPADLPGQRVLSSTLDVAPCTWDFSYRDYWGTIVNAFEVLTPHQRLELRAESLVRVHDRSGTPATATWADLETPALRDALAEYLAHSDVTDVPDDVVEIARAQRDDTSPHATAVAVCDALRDELEYVPGFTTVHTPAAEAWTTRKGVCQDMAHLSLGALRSLGIPARYVSGYLHPGGAGRGEQVVGESHAWVEWWAGEWMGYDPTNRGVVGDHHVILGRGREYADVAPLKGVYNGRGTEELTVQVRITRLD